MTERCQAGQRFPGELGRDGPALREVLAEQLEGTGVTVTALHPATLMDTNLVREGGLSPRTTVAEGAEAVLQLVTAPGMASGQYYNGLLPGRANAQAYDPQSRARLRASSQTMTGIPPATR